MKKQTLSAIGICTSNSHPKTLTLYSPLISFQPNTSMRIVSTLAGVLLAASLATTQTVNAQTTPAGSYTGNASVHTADSLRAAIQGGQLVLPAQVTGGAVFAGLFKDAPAVQGVRVPVIVFMHGSSGTKLPAILQWQRWLAEQGYASLAPDSMGLPDRIVYKSPIDKDTYERIHALRSSEINPAVDALRAQPWADMQRLVLAGTSEGSVPVARHDGAAFVAKIMYAWSCETNYFVTSPQSRFEVNKPVLNIISNTDPFFSKSNHWLGNPDAQGHCGAALKDNKHAAVLLIPDAPHTLFTLPAALHSTAGFLAYVFNKSQ